MDKHALWKWLILVVMLAGSLVLVTPPKEKIRLGLDLKGGTSFAVKIDDAQIRRDVLSESPDLEEEAVDERVKAILAGARERALEVIRNRIDNSGIEEPTIYQGKDGRIIIQLPGIDEAKRKDAEESIKKVAFLEFRMVHEKNDDLVRDLFADDLAPEGYRISTVADGGNFFAQDTSFPATQRTRDHLKRIGRFHAPSGYELLLQKDKVQGQTVYRASYVKVRREFSGELLKKAGIDYGPLGQPTVNLRFDGQGTKRFAKVTKDYAPGGPRNPNPDNFRQLAIVLDGSLFSAPVIREAIFGGSAEISGNFTVDEAKLLAGILNAGSLPAPVKIVETRSVDPTLGADSIRSGLKAVAIGGVGVLIFMLVYYLACGFVADLALILNMLLLPLGMIIAGGILGLFVSEGGGGGPIRLPVLTLPGIAGILLTIGMAVDANVLIFERIREEIKSGKTLWSAVLAGYDRAFVTITDANVTTLITGIILYVVGSGPIRGFAVTLCAGIAVSMFTALVVTKLFFSVLINNLGVKSLKMLSIVGTTTIDFVSKRKVAAIVSVIVIVGSMGTMIFRGVQEPSQVFGVDFLGGSSVTYSFDQEQPIEDLRAALTGVGLQDVRIQYQQELTAGGEKYLQVSTTSAGEESEVSSGSLVTTTLAKAFPDAGFNEEQVDEVGPQIGKELKGRAIKAIIWSLVFIVLYISWRFEFGFALGAIVALAHDVLVTLGIYCLFGRQLSLPIVAALLTIVGYSVNDTIVVFDRIREDLRLVKQSSFKQICNLSINQTLSRTLLTSATTLITVVMLLVFGGGAINDFALALCIGVLVGTYSSIFVATPVVLLWHRDKRPAFAVKK